MKNLFIYILIILNFALTCFLYFHIQSKVQNTKVADLKKLYSEFDMTSELNLKYTNVSRERLSRIDSLQKLITMKYEELGTVSSPNDRLNTSRKITTAQSELEQYSLIDQQVKNDLETQIWNQLNAYINQYGIEHDCNVILGAKNDGSILFSEDQSNITEQLTSFVNDKYKGR